MMLFPSRLAAAITVGLFSATVLLLGVSVPGWDRALGLLFAVCAAAFAMFGVLHADQRNAALSENSEENADLAIEEERTRIARDLHDILGHSLTVITVKAELARRLLDVDPERARPELADLERLSRDALADVRRAVAGFGGLAAGGDRPGRGPRWSPPASRPTCPHHRRRCPPACGSSSPGRSARASRT